ncbi:PAS domain S-box protein [Mucilaginibacter jinjuensis]|uniref:histidine kinase n=1 Tax=Mucilaginibacter jinjuensis TaxID=1176721 RepID=A0ABY7TA98_9SPHI|nr:PAS domain S-box protein [Mucilaginibacter jinjuensis]WCT13439.1 PAS domain S-box protein [Mucilaginibacter jinjuensis]
MMTKFNRDLRLGYGISILIVLVVMLVSYLMLQNLLQTDRAVEQGALSMQRLEKVLSVMKDAETGQRGYLLSGRSNFLEPYNGAYTQAMSLTGDLIKQTAGNKVEQDQIRAVLALLQNRLPIFAQLVAKKQRGEAITPADMDAGKSAMDALRQSVARAENYEQDILAQRRRSLNHYVTLAPLFLLLAALTAIVVTCYSYRNVVSNYRDRERLTGEIQIRERLAQDLNEELSAANEEITAANEELIAINEELLEAREDLSNTNDSLERKVTERTRALQDSKQEAQALNEELTAMNEEMAATNEELTASNEELAESREQLQVMLDELNVAHEYSVKLASIVESSDDAIIGKNLKGIVTSWNRGAEQIFGYTEHEIVGKSILTLIPEDRQHEEPMILGKLRNGEKIDHYETVRRRQDGRLIHVALTISPIHDKEGRVIGVSKIARDITEQKQDEQRKNDFIGMASHELKTPLTSLNALIQVLQRRLAASTDPFVPQALDKATRQTRKMTSLINGFLNVSRLESGKLEIAKSQFDLVALIREDLDEMRLTVSSHTFTLDAPGQVMVTADREKIGSVITNLLSNAVKYSPKANQVEIGCQVTDGEVIVSVHDEGMGIRPQDLSRIFDRYYRSGSEQIKHISGFGVGLYLSAEIIGRHGGTIRAASKKGAGSTFSFTLPLA